MANILIADDEPSILELVSLALRQRGHHARIASDGNELSNLQAEGWAEVVILDVFMPGKDGLEIIGSFRRKFPKLGIIAISGGGNIGFDECLAVAKKLGAHAVLQKPFRISELLEVVTEVLCRADQEVPIMKLSNGLRSPHYSDMSVMEKMFRTPIRSQL
jgi:DNA-binding response OmpR family regulator